MSNFEPIDRTSLMDKAVKAIIGKIFDNEYKIGDRLPPEREIASQMGISRGIISKCILDLENKGLVKIVPRHGVIVVDYKKNAKPEFLDVLMNYNSNYIDSKMFENLMDTRKLIEFECTRLACNNRTSEDIEVLRTIIEKMKSLDKLDDFVEEIFKFHIAIAMASGNMVYAMILNSFKKTLIWLISLAYGNSGKSIFDLDLYNSMVNAIESKDVVAVEHMKSILNIGVDMLVKKIDNETEVKNGKTV